MLLKKIITTYGKSVTQRGLGEATDRIHAHLDASGDVAEVISFRNDALTAFSVCRPFYVDHKAASLIDTLAPDLEEPYEDYMNDIALPAEVIWVEFDAAALAYARQKRGHYIPEAEIEQLDFRGILFDGRDPTALNMKLFRGTSDGQVIDPLAQHIFPRDSAGNLDMEKAITRIMPHMNRYFSTLPDMTQEAATEMLDDERESAASAFVFAYGMLALMKSQPDDIEIGTSEIFTKKERKTAQKFGKTHITEGPQSHITINLTAPAKRYVAQLEEDAEDRAAIASGQAPRVRHEVREHVRRYKSGKVIKVKAHERGSKPDTRPTLVTASDDTPTLH